MPHIKQRDGEEVTEDLWILNPENGNEYLAIQNCLGSAWWTDSNHVACHLDGSLLMFNTHSKKIDARWHFIGDLTPVSAYREGLVLSSQRNSTFSYLILGDKKSREMADYWQIIGWVFQIVGNGSHAIVARQTSNIFSIREDYALYFATIEDGRVTDEIQIADRDDYSRACSLMMSGAQPSIPIDIQ